MIIISFFAGYFSKDYLRNNYIFNKKKIISKELSEFISYSQFFEDLILFCIFYDVKNGFYIDVGANDPNIYTVTKAFYLRGWYGINIEPLPNKYKNLVKYRQRDINLQIGVGKIKGKASFIEKGMLSRLILKDYIKNNSKIISTINIDTMLNICNKYIPKKTIIQFCKIDIEGGEKDALLGYDFENYRPKVFCIESTKPGTSIPCYEEWENILFQNDYSFAFEYKINRYYIDNRIEGLRDRFIQAEKIIKIFIQKKSNNTNKNKAYK